MSVQNFHPDRTDPRGLQKNQRAVEDFLDAGIIRSDGRVDGAVALGGRRGGQVLYFGTQSGDDGELHSNPSKDGLILLGDDSAYDEANSRVGIGTQAPSTALHVVSGAATTQILIDNTATDGDPTVVLRLPGIKAWTLGLDDGDGDAFKVVEGQGLGVAQRLKIEVGGRITLGPGSPRFIGRTSAAADPTTTELPADKDFGLHKNTSSGNVFLAYNDGGTIVKVQLA